MARPARALNPTARSGGRGAANGSAAEGAAPATAPSPSITSRLTFLVHMVSARVALLGNRHFREHDLNHFSARMLVLLLEKESLRTGELVDLMLLPQSTISSQLQVLQKKGLIRRRRSRQDNRSVVVTLTPAGRELAEDCEGLSVRANALMLRDIPEEETRQAFAFLHKVNDTLLELEKQNLYPFHEPEQVQELVARESEPAPAARRAPRKAPAPGARSS